MRLSKSEQREDRLARRQWMRWRYRHRPRAEAEAAIEAIEAQQKQCDQLALPLSDTTPQEEVPG